MIEKYIDVLHQVRRGEIGLENFFYKEEVDSKGYSVDANHLKRFQLLTAMRFDGSKDDRALLTELFKQEIIMDEKAPFQGIGLGMELNAFLLLQFSSVENVWLFVKAKSANFDTHCGFDYEYLVSAGIGITFDYVHNSEHELKARFYDYVGDSVETCPISESDLETWREHKNTWYNNDVKKFSIEDEIDLASELGETEIVKQKIGQWKEQQHVWDAPKLNSLAYYERKRNNLQGEIWANEQILSLKSTGWDIAVQLNTLCSLYLESNNAVKGWEKILLARQYTNQITHWPNIGLARMLIERGFDVVLKINDPHNTVVQQAYKWAIKEMHGVKQAHNNLLEKALKCAELMSDVANSKYYLKEFNKAQNELEKMLRK